VPVERDYRLIGMLTDRDGVVRVVARQKITLAEAVEAYTLGSALAEFEEKEKGSITPSKLADMVILSDNIFDSSINFATVAFAAASFPAMASARRLRVPCGWPSVVSAAA
jgi:Amidohydrolase family